MTNHITAGPPAPAPGTTTTRAASIGPGSWRRPRTIISSFAWRVILIIAALGVLAGWVPHIAASSESGAAAGTLLLAILAGGLCCRPAQDRPVCRTTRSLTLLSGLVAVAGVLFAVVAARLMLRMIFAGPINAAEGDMLLVIRNGVQRMLAGLNPYVLYHVPWEAPLAYGPWLWMPYAIPYMLGADLRLLTLVAHLVVPGACIVAAALSVRDRKPLDGALVLGLAGLLLWHQDMMEFQRIGHTKVYWPVLLAFALLVRCDAWTAACVVLGSLAVARTTMVSLFPVVLLYLWHRHQLTRTRVALMFGSALLPFVPFLIADPRAVVYAMHGQYLRVMKGFVWTSTTWVQHTFGVTGLLLRHGLQAYAEAVQVAALVVVYALAFRAFGRGARPEPWFVAALLTFSMTTLWPVTYVYFDVFQLAAAVLAAEVVARRRGVGPFRMPLMLTAAAAVLVVLVAAVAPGARYSIDIGAPDAAGFTGGGFGRDAAMRDGDRTFVWVEGDTARVRLPRASRSATRLVITAAAHAPAGSPPQRVMASLNGRPLGVARLGPGWSDLTFEAPRSAWIYGFNVLELRFAYAVAPAAVGEGPGVQPLSARVDLVRLGG